MFDPKPSQFQGQEFDGHHFTDITSSSVKLNTLQTTANSLNLVVWPKKSCLFNWIPFYHWRPRKSATSKNITGSQKLRFRRNNQSQLRFNCGLLQYENCNRLKWSTHCSWSKIVFQIIPFLSTFSLWTMTYSYTNLARFGISDQMCQPVVLPERERG